MMKVHYEAHSTKEQPEKSDENEERFLFCNGMESSTLMNSIERDKVRKELRRIQWNLVMQRSLVTLKRQASQTYGSGAQ
jgi:hypothetical protein